MINKLEVAKQMQATILEQDPGYKTVRVTESETECTLICGFDNHSVIVEFLDDSYMVAITQQYSKIEPRDRLFGNLQRVITRDYPTTGNVATEMLRELADTQLPHGKDNIITLKPIAM